MPFGRTRVAAGSGNGSAIVAILFTVELRTVHPVATDPLKMIQDQPLT